MAGMEPATQRSSVGNDNKQGPQGPEMFSSLKSFKIQPPTHILKKSNVP